MERASPSHHGAPSFETTSTTTFGDLVRRAGRGEWGAFGDIVSLGEKEPKGGNSLPPLLTEWRRNKRVRLQCDLPKCFTKPTLANLEELGGGIVTL